MAAVENIYFILFFGVLVRGFVS
uniref:Uncharacterized protein n=1 Tax=Rhizophora mucronata TaxID=61149 RepID=A0A2P2P3G7_RHIMU